MNSTDMPVLRPLTQEAEAALGEATEVVLESLPFRVGRDSRTPIKTGWFGLRERREPQAVLNNELYLMDTGKLKNVSREHFQILADKHEPDRYILEDRGSACGTIVGERVVGGHRQTESCRLDPDTVVVVGTRDSPFVFRFCLREAAGSPHTVGDAALPRSK